MKKKLTIFSTILLISLMVAGGTLSWFAFGSDLSIAEPKMGTVDVDVINSSLKNIKVKNSGSNEIYIRVRLIPQWDDQSLSVANVKIKITDNWIEKDGYYYYKHKVKRNERTANLIRDIIYTDLTEEYEGARFTLEVIAEGVQSTNEAWKDTWSINSLPF